MVQMLKTLVVIAACLPCWSCATLINNDTLQIPVTTSPPGASVTVNGLTYTTPASLTVVRNVGDQLLIFKHPDFADRPIALTEVAAPQIILNVFFGLLGVIFLAVDASSERGWSVDPEEIHLDLASGCYLDVPDQAFGEEPICPEVIKSTIAEFK